MRLFGCSDVSDSQMAHQESRSSHRERQSHLSSCRRRNDFQQTVHKKHSNRRQILRCGDKTVRHGFVGDEREHKRGHANLVLLENVLLPGAVFVRVLRRLQEHRRRLSHVRSLRTGQLQTQEREIHGRLGEMQKLGQIAKTNGTNDTCAKGRQFSVLHVRNYLN